MHRGKESVLETILFKWIDNAQSRNALLTETLVNERAEELAPILGDNNYKVSIYCPERFTVFNKLHREGAAAAVTFCFITLNLCNKCENFNKIKKKTKKWSESQLL